MRASVGPSCCTSATSACSIDFPAGTVREWAGEPVAYRIDTDRALVESCIERHVEDWVNELFLSCRFRAHRDGPYNEYIYTFFKCLTLERMAYCEGHYASRSERSDEMFRCGDYLVQKRCPHLRADLERFGRSRTASSSAWSTTGGSSWRRVAA